jgi:hypothetical protein
MSRFVNVRLRIVGLDTVVKNLNKSLSNIENSTSKGFYKAGMFILRKSKQQVPVDTGNLRASGAMVFKGAKGVTKTLVGESRLIKSRITEKKRAIISQTIQRAKQDQSTVTNELRGAKFGFAIVYSARYAAVQHETRRFKHPRGNWKYLQRPIMEHKKDIIRIVAENARKGKSPK